VIAISNNQKVSRLLYFDREHLAGV
jgi:hypothetical protein